MQPTRVYLSVQPLNPRPTGGQAMIPRPPLRYRASWWTRGTSTELYRSKAVASQEEAAQLAFRWFERQNKESTGRLTGTRLLDTTDQPERFGYSHKTAAQLDAEIAAALTKGAS